MADTPTTPVDEVPDDLDAFDELFSGKGVPAAEHVPTEKTDPKAPAEDTGADDDAPEDEAEVDETEEEVNAEEEATDEESEDESDDEDDLLKPKPKNRKSFQKRIDEVTRDKYDAERRAEDLEKRLKALEESRETPKRQTAAVNDGAPGPDDRGEDGELLYPLGEFDPKFIHDNMKFVLDGEREQMRIEARQEAEQAAATRERETLQTQWDGRLSEAEKDFPDLRESLAELGDTFKGIEPAYGEYLATTIMQMDAGPAVLYYLSNNPKEAQRIVDAGATKATLELGRLEARIQVALDKRSTPPARVSAAPPPPKPARGNGGRTSVRDDTDDLDAFEKKFFAKK